jgi:2-polyprenyl-3-methyl-5-hydroxy-6-metoxy-1,4-benzoquinol methylase
MTDFRDEIYDRYVSAFKGLSRSHARALDPRWAATFFQPLTSAIPSDGSVLDLGCGTGAAMHFLADQGFTVRGVDRSDEQVALAVGRGLDVVAADAFEFLEAESAAYDGLIALDFVEHFSKDELLRLLRLIESSLKPGGVAMIRTPNGSALFGGQVIYGDLSHLTILNPNSLEQALLLTGFEQIEFFETGPVAVSFRTFLRKCAWSLVRAAARLARFAESAKWQDIWTENMVCVCRAGGSAS